MRLCVVLLAACALAAVLAPRKAAATIVAPVSAKANSTFAADFGIGNTFDQSGLTEKYSAGEDFDDYIDGDPTHSSSTFDEWFSDEGATSAEVIYDLGSVKTIDAFALWNEELYGIPSAQIFTSVDDTTYEFLQIIQPTDNAINARYLPEVFYFTAAVDFRYFKIFIDSCPSNQNNTAVKYCTIGEVAFREASQVSAIPVPAALPLFLTALLSLGLAGWRRARTTG